MKNFLSVKIFSYLENNVLLVLVLVYFLNLAINLLLATFHSNQFLLRYESLLYLIKSLEITQGDFTPLKTHSMGLSLFTAFFFYFFKSSSIFVNMAYAQFLSIFINSVIIFPFYALCKKILDTKTMVISLVLFSVSYWLRLSSIGFWTESLFAIFFLLSLLFLYKAQDHKKYLFLSAVFGGISYWIRPNGIFVLLILLLSLLFWRKIYRINWYYLLLVFFIFFAVSAPFLYQRYLFFGSPFFYGENSNYWVDTYEQLWGKNYPINTFIGYLKSHSLIELFNNFIIRGAGAVAFGYLAFSLPLTIFFLWGIFKSFKNNIFLPLLISLVVWIVTLTPIFHVFFTGRHLFPLVPIIIIVTAFGIKNVASKTSNEHAMIFLTTILAFIFLLVGFVYPAYYYQNDMNYFKKLQVGRWIANNIKGKIVVNEDWDFIMMNLTDTRVGGQSMDQFIAPVSNISTIYPGYFTSFDEAMRWFKNNEINYIVLNYNPKSSIPKLRILPEKRRPHYLEVMYQKFDYDASWLSEVYKINWDIYYNEIKNGKN